MVNGALYLVFTSKQSLLKIDFLKLIGLISLRITINYWFVTLSNKSNLCFSSALSSMFVVLTAIPCCNLLTNSRCIPGLLTELTVLLINRYPRGFALPIVEGRMETMVRLAPCTACKPRLSGLPLDTDSMAIWEADMGLDNFVESFKSWDKWFQRDLKAQLLRY